MSKAVDPDSASAHGSFRIKGRQFSIPELLGHDERFEALQKDAGCMLCIARLAPQVRRLF